MGKHPKYSPYLMKASKKLFNKPFHETSDSEVRKIKKYLRGLNKKELEKLRTKSY